MLFAGRIQPIKGLDLLLRAVSHLPDGRNTRLLVVGGNAGKADELVRMKSLANELGIGNKVVFMGVVEHEKMPLFYNAADVCIIPSYHESFGLVAVEALATGTPVVASRVGGLATIVKDGETGYLVDELSPEAFALHICLLLGDEEVRQVMAGAARPSVEEYAWSLMARRVIKVYEEQIAPHVNGYRLAWSIMSESKTLIFFGAHPDDETFAIGGTLAHYAEAGVKVYYACATRGEAGFAAPEYMKGYTTVGDMRWAELECAAKVLGLAGVIYLGYRDSGMRVHRTTSTPRHWPLRRLKRSPDAWLR